MKLNSLPSFFKIENDDDYQVDNGYEALLDFFIAWTVKCAQFEYKNANEILHIYAKKILLTLLFGDNSTIKQEDIIFKDIQTYRQWKSVDLCFDITIEKNDIEEKYALVIENKFYSNLRENQLKRYRDIIVNHYKDKSVKISFVLLTIDYCRKNLEIEKKECLDLGYKFLTIEDLQSSAGMDNNQMTDNYLFDEFWFRFNR